MRNRENGMSTAVTVIRYVVPFAMVLIPLIFASMLGGTKGALIVIGILFLLYAGYLLLGYFKKWTHIFCYYQSLDHKPLTPDKADWNTLRAGDVYIMPALHALVGIGVLLFGLLSK